MEIMNSTAVFNGGAQVEISVKVDEDALLSGAVTEQFNEKLDEINGEVI